MLRSVYTISQLVSSHGIAWYHGARVALVNHVLRSIYEANLWLVLLELGLVHVWPTVRCDFEVNDSRCTRRNLSSKLKSGVAQISN